MSLLAAAAAQPPNQSGHAGVLLACLALFALVYLLSAAVWPYKRCLHCQDRKKLASPWGMGAFRMCPRCHGKGKEFRVPARVWRGLFGHGWGRHD